LFIVVVGICLTAGAVAIVTIKDRLRESILDRFNSQNRAQTAAQRAAAAMERVREALVLRLAEHGSPRFTCSVGLADSGHGESIDEILDAADLAMSMAKYDGGNRVRAAWVDDAMEADPRGPASID